MTWIFSRHVVFAVKPNSQGILLRTSFFCCPSTWENFKNFSTSLKDYKGMTFWESCQDRPNFIQLISRDHNTKRAKLSLDVCAMFVAAKAIFSNFAIARARLSNKINLKVERKRSRPRARQKSKVTKNSLSRHEHRTDIKTESRSLIIMVSCWYLFVYQDAWRACEIWKLGSQGMK